MENPIKMDDLGVPLFSETAISFYMYRIYKHNVSTSQLRLGCPDADKNAKLLRCYKDVRGKVETLFHLAAKRLNSISYRSENSSCLKDSQIHLVQSEVSKLVIVWRKII